mgnify:CR=1 FL=1
MDIKISTKRLKEIIQEEISKKYKEEGKSNSEFAKYIFESLTNKKGGNNNE